MSGSEGKADPRPIIAAHVRTLRTASDGQSRPIDCLVMYAFPVVAAGTAAVAGTTFDGTLVAGLLTVAGLAGAFLFSLMVQLLETITTWADSQPAPGARRTRQAALYEQLAANAAYAALIAFVTAGVLVFTAVTSSAWLERTLTAVSSGFLVHFALTVLMVMRRVFLLSVGRVNEARTRSPGDSPVVGPRA